MTSICDLSWSFSGSLCVSGIGRLESLGSLGGLSATSVGIDTRIELPWLLRESQLLLDEGSDEISSIDFFSSETR